MTYKRGGEEGCYCMCPSQNSCNINIKMGKFFFGDILPILGTALKIFRLRVRIRHIPVFVGYVYPCSRSSAMCLRSGQRPCLKNLAKLNSRHTGGWGVGGVLSINMCRYGEFCRRSTWNITI